MDARVACVLSASRLVQVHSWQVVTAPWRQHSRSLSASIHSAYLWHAVVQLVFDSRPSLVSLSALHVDVLTMCAMCAKHKHNTAQRSLEQRSMAVHIQPESTFNVPEAGRTRSV